VKYAAGAAHVRARSARAARARAARARFIFKKKPGSRPASDHIFFTFINIPTVNFELGNGLPREFWS
jgi:hypothetical protein